MTFPMTSVQIMLLTESPHLHCATHSVWQFIPDRDGGDAGHLDQLLGVKKLDCSCLDAGGA
jgi:hypothetical protein